ncbi:MAG: calcium:proton antiporter [Vicinamibacterales bacterium]
MNQPSEGTAPLAERLPFPHFDPVILTSSNDAYSDFHGLSIRLDKRYSSGLFFSGNYQISKMIDNNSGQAESNDTAFRWNKDADRAYSRYHQRHRSNITFGYELPFGQGKRWLGSGALASVFGGWQLSGAVRMQSGVPFTVSGAATTLATLGMVVPTFTTTTPGPQFSAPQLAFAAVTALGLYGLFVAVQTGRHRDYFLPTTDDGVPVEENAHAAPPSAQMAWLSMGLLLVALVAVVGKAKLVSPTVERAVVGAGLPLSFVGVVIASLVLLPETLAAVRAAQRKRLQISLNLAFGSAMASIGLTIPSIALASIWLPVPLHLGLAATHIVLLALTVIVTVLTVVPGRATLLQAGVHLAILAAYLFLSISP